MCKQIETIILSQFPNASKETIDELCELYEDFEGDSRTIQIIVRVFEIGTQHGMDRKLS